MSALTHPPASVILSFTHTSCLPLPILLPSSRVSGRGKGWPRRGCGDSVWQGALSPLGGNKRSASCFFPQRAKKTQPGSWSSQKECTALCLLFFFSFLLIYHKVSLSPFGRSGEAGVPLNPLSNLSLASVSDAGQGLGLSPLLLDLEELWKKAQECSCFSSTRGSGPRVDLHTCPWGKGTCQS